MASSEDLKHCPACGKQAGELIENKTSRFPFRVQCSACGWMTDQVKLVTLAVKLWNEAKRESKARTRPKTKTAPGWWRAAPLLTVHSIYAVGQVSDEATSVHHPGR